MSRAFLFENPGIFHKLFEIVIISGISATYKTMKPQSSIVALLLPFILIFGYLIFSPGLSGPFLLDDHLHLPKLEGNDGQIDTQAEVYQLIFSGGRTIGRQLSYLSLLINDNAWPADPYEFKRFNVLLHLLNGVLVFVFARMLIRLMRVPNDESAHADWIALVAMSLWLVHPLHLSPTMLVIQRMTLLAGSFSLLALIAYLHGRRLALVNPTVGYRWMVIGFGFFLTLGIFCKEPAIMTVCYVIVLEFTLLSRNHLPRPNGWRLWAMVFLGVPLLAIVGYFLAILPYIDQLYLKRDFNVVERLLTEFRVLMQYLRVILFPSISASGPYHDDFTISRGLFDPLTTLLSIISVVGLVGVALWQRQRNSLLAFAILWFFMAHLLESTVLPLEIYFEHRNYLPMFGFVFAISYWILKLRGKLARVGRIGIAAFISLTLSITFVSARVWGDADQIANVWAMEHPGSARAQIGAIKFWSRTGDAERLKQQFDRAMSFNPNDAGLALLRFIIDQCRDPSAPSIGGDIAVLERIVPTSRFEHGSLEAIEWVLKESRKIGCEIQDEKLERIVNLYLTNPRFQTNENASMVLYRTLASIYGRRGDLDASIRALDLAYQARPSYHVALNQAWLLATAGLFEDSAEYLQLARETPPQSRGEWLWRNDEIARIEALIEQIKQSAQDQTKPAGNNNAQ